MGTSKLLWGQPDKMLGWETRDGLVFHPGGSTNIPSCYRNILQKPEISARTDGLSGSPNFDSGADLLKISIDVQRRALAT